MLEVMYDRNADVLYIHTRDVGIAYSDESNEGIDFRFSDATDELCGATIERFKRRWGRDLPSLSSILSVGLNVSRDELTNAIDGATNA